jgi:hypothetical protein
LRDSLVRDVRRVGSFDVYAVAYARGEVGDGGEQVKKRSRCCRWEAEKVEYGALGGVAANREAVLAPVCLPIAFS